MALSFRRARTTVAALILGVLLAAGYAAPARAAEWFGSFTGAYAANPTPMLAASTSVYFTVSPTLGQAQVRVFDQAGTQLKMCSSGTSCSVSSNPAPGASLSYYAELWAYRGGVLSYLSTSSTVVVTDPGWTGSFTSSYAANPTPVLNASTGVWFTVSADLSQALVRIFDGTGSQLKQCTSGSTCSVSSNPGPGYTLTYRAELWAWRDGVLMQLATSPLVTVTDPGWTGDFTEVYAANPLSVGSASTGVFFQVTPDLSAGSMKVYDTLGTYITTCYAGPSCSISSNPAPGTSRAYYAEIWALRGAETVLYKTSPLVMVTDPGWTGQFTGSEVLSGDEAFMGATSATFTWDQPLQYAWVDIVDSSGEVLGHCTTVGSLECSAGAALGPEETRLVHAEARVHGIGGAHVTIASSAPVELTGMDAEALAELLLYAPPTALVPLLGAVRADAVVAARSNGMLSVLTDEGKCLALGALDPVHPYGSSASRTQLACGSAAKSVLATLILSVGMVAAITAIFAIIDNDGGPDPEPDPDPDPGDGGSGTGGDGPGGPGPGEMCRVTGVNGQEYVLKNVVVDTHIAPDHIENGQNGKSKWGPEAAEAPRDVDQWLDFICEQLQQPADEQPGNQPQTIARRYEVSYDIGLEADHVTTTPRFTIVVDSDGMVVSAYPGW
jgi:hypothetical protein